MLLDDQKQDEVRIGRKKLYVSSYAPTLLDEVYALPLKD
jgi:hypothetical protein